ncbi:DnaJ-like protein subfamily C member 2 [Nematocida minor]|uniref:DnaJ-like protein subfamily C member 2 n=1 Tax=Nematocida minor TaxID=1912983 RepID=UPI002220C325|nr:DnaJ-like protein subfamily C member 2 [Nematocida minor]KAI5192043.1 DnaJ-like protein subfamily C member 2 [Nematocida minor]
MSVTSYTGQRTFRDMPKKQIKKTQEKMKSPKELFSKYSVDEIKDWKSLDLYYLMGITQEETKSYTEADYKDAFKKQAKLFHPDRLLSCKIEDGGASFIALTKAHETLGNPHKKRLYDFIAFDESIPIDKEYTAEEFFSTFDEVFERNLAFSTKPCSLSLGDLNSKDAEIVSFYKFWQSFESVRSFEFLCNDEDYQSREMRRHAAVQNKKMLDEKKSDDNQRIRKLVALAIKHDPRVNKESKSKPKENITVDADGWKSTEVDALTKIAAKTPARTRNRFEVVFSALSRFAPSRTKKDVQAKLLKIDALLQKTQAKK